MSETELLSRLEKLERDNRRLKAVALGALLLPSVLVLMGEARGSRTVTADKLVLVDSQDRTRAILQTDSMGATLTFLDAMGNKRMVLSGGTGPVGNTYGYLELGEDAATEKPLILASHGGHGGATLSDGGLVMRAYPLSGKHGFVMIQGPAGGPELIFTDSEGYTVNLGITDIVTPSTGEKHTTSAASLVLFGKDNKVIWQAP